MKVPLELKIRYLNRRMDELAHLKRCLEEEDYSFAQIIGHQVKGNAKTFDVPQMAQIGIQMEDAAKRKDKAQVMVMIEKMKFIVQGAQLERFFDSSYLYDDSNAARPIPVTVLKQAFYKNSL